jgi:cardiolipin synthase
MPSVAAFPVKSRASNANTNGKVRQPQPTQIAKQPRSTLPNVSATPLLIASAAVLAGCGGPTASPWALAGLGLAAGLAAIPSLAASAHILLNQRGSTSALPWVLSSWLLPLLGPALWFGIGADPHIPPVTDAKARFWTDRGSYRKPDEAPPDEIPGFVPDYFRPVIEATRKITRSPLTGGNLVAPLHNGEEAFPEMIKAIDDEPAGGFVYFGFFIFENDETGKRFADALERAAKRGVRVRIIVDKWGALASRPSGYSLLKKRGLPVVLFNPKPGLRNGIPWNVVYHKKFMTTSRTCFIGSMNVGDTYLIGKDGDDAIQVGNYYTVKKSAISNPHQDFTYRITGPAVRASESVFARDWELLTGEALPTGTAEAKRAGSSYIRVFRSAPDEDFEAFKKVIMLAISAAREKIRITTAYFAPDTEFLSAMKLAALRGVKVEIIMSADAHIPFIDWGARATYRELTEAGVRIFYQPPPFDHTKFVTVDGFGYSLKGSTNLGPRYYTGNEEVNTEDYDPELGRRLDEHFDALKAQSKEVTLETIASWPWYERLRNGFFRMFSSLY